MFYLGIWIIMLGVGNLTIFGVKSQKILYLSLGEIVVGLLFLVTDYFK